MSSVGVTDRAAGKVVYQCMKTKSLTSSEMEFWQDAFVRFLGPSLPVSGSAAEADKALAEWQKRARMVRSAGSGFVTEGPSETCPECRHELGMPPKDCTSETHARVAAEYPR